MSAPWSISNRPAATVAASASQAAPGQPMVNRLRALQATLVGTGAGSAQVVVRDGAAGVGTIIWTGDLAVPANGSSVLAVSDLDLRASLGNALTVETASGGGASTQLAVNAQGDLVVNGYGYGQQQS